MKITERVREIIYAGEWYPGARKFTIDLAAAENISELVGTLEAELEARRVVMAEQERIANMPRAYSAGG